MTETKTVAEEQKQLDLPWYKGRTPFDELYISAKDEAEETGRIIAIDGNVRRLWEHDVDFILRACNAHHDLLEACEAIADHARAILQQERSTGAEWMLRVVDAAIAKATPKGE